MAGKTVFVLGAGFSYAAKIPMQASLLQELDRFGKTDPDARNHYRYFRNFFRDTIGQSAKTYKIEDVFTILDECLMTSEAFRGIEPALLDKVNLHLLETLRLFLISRANAAIASGSTSHKQYLRFANTLLKARDSYRKKDRLSIISLNWDHYFEKVLASRFPNHQKISLDYCTYDYSFANSGKDRPSILKKAYGKRNLKILKPHGSANWGYCSNCGRLYISYGKKIVTKYECIKYCNKIYGNTSLAPVLITPTYLKELSIRPLKDIWNNIGIELAEAENLVFVGYSLRPEDYLFRYMLSKYVQDKKSIHIIDFEADPAKKTAAENDLRRRYVQFFQRQTVAYISVDGWENNIAHFAQILK